MAHCGSPANGEQERATGSDVHGDADSKGNKGRPYGTAVAAPAVHCAPLLRRHVPSVRPGERRI